jgi:hypothetical protein
MDREEAKWHMQEQEKYLKDKALGFDRYDCGSIPILKPEEKERMLKFDLSMSYGQFGWAIGSTTGCGTAQMVVAEMVDLEAMAKAKEKK